MIVAQRQIHHRTNHNLIVDRHGPLLNRVHAEDRGLGWVEDRGAEERAEDPAVGDREGATAEFFDRQFVVADGIGEAFDFSFDPAEGHVLNLMQHRHGQPALGTDGDAEIDVLVIDDILPFKIGVDAREFLERHHDGTREKAHKPKADTMHFLESLFEFRAEAHHFGEVDFIEGGEDRRRLLGLHEALGDGLADLRHLHATFTGGVKIFRRGVQHRGHLL